MQDPVTYIADLVPSLACAVDPRQPAKLDAQHCVQINYETFFVAATGGEDPVAVRAARLLRPAHRSGDPAALHPDEAVAAARVERQAVLFLQRLDAGAVREHAG